MSSSLRSQFLIPIVAMLLLTCTAVTLISWMIASRTTLATTETRLRNLLQLCAVHAVFSCASNLLLDSARAYTKKDPSN
jgi:hypothetical protein